jgi:hypothetical protein
MKVRSEKRDTSAHSRRVGAVALVPWPKVTVAGVREIAASPPVGNGTPAPFFTPRSTVLWSLFALTMILVVTAVYVAQLGGAAGRAFALSAYFLSTGIAWLGGALLCIRQRRWLLLVANAIVPPPFGSILIGFMFWRLPQGRRP